MTQDMQSAGHIPPRIDAHHHLWRYGPDEFGWINGQMSTIRRDFLTHDLKPTKSKIKPSTKKRYSKCPLCRRVAVARNVVQRMFKDV